MDLVKKERAYLISLLNTCHFPRLRRANFVNVDCSDYFLYLAIHRFVVNHRKSLKNLIMSSPPKIVRTGPVNEKFRSFYENLDEYQSILQSISDVQLETLWINAVNFEGLSPWNLSNNN